MSATLSSYASRATSGHTAARISKGSSSVKVINQELGNDWAMYHGDSIEVLQGIPTDSIHYQIMSLPFESLYTYSASEHDMGNCRTSEEFWEHYEFLIKEQLRITMPGRLVSVHCMNLPRSKERDGVIGLRDFRGEIIRRYCGTEAQILHEAKLILMRLGRDTSEIDAALLDASLRTGGFIYHSEVVIWKDPVTAMQRTKALGLLHKQLVKDSTMSRQGIPDYLVTLRKPGVNPERVAGPLTRYVGDDPPQHSGDTVKSPLSVYPDQEVPGSGATRYSIDVWQRYASPVWFDINASRTLTREGAREEADERHICALQLDVIERAMDLWSNPYDRVLDPFGGIGSTGHIALMKGRRFIGIELKESYYKQAVANLIHAAKESGREKLFV